MKQFLMLCILLLTLATEAGAAPQKDSQAQQQKELVDSGGKDAVEVYSDTTSATQPTAPAATGWNDDTAEEDLEQSITRIVRTWSTSDTLAILLVLAILFAIFVLPPLLLLLILIYFIHRNRKRRQQIAQTAMQQGTTEQTTGYPTETINDEYQKGIRQLFAGIGLMIFLGYAAGKWGFGLGALVACIGLGKIAAAKLGKGNDNHLNNNNHDEEIISQ